MVLEGKSVFGGIAIGPYLFITGRIMWSRGRKWRIPPRRSAFEAAREKAKEQLQALYEKAKKEVGETNAMILKCIR